MALRGKRLVDLALAESKLPPIPEFQQSKGREFNSVVNIENNSRISLNEHDYGKSRPTRTVADKTSNEETSSCTVKTVKLRQTVDYKDSADSDSPLFSDSDEYKHPATSNPNEFSSSDEEPKRKIRYKKKIKACQSNHATVIGQEGKKDVQQPQSGQEPRCTTEQEEIVYEQVVLDGTQVNNNPDDNKIVNAENREREENVDRDQGQEIREILCQKRKRSLKGLSNSNQWQRQVNMEKRMQGESYKGLKKINGKFSLSVEKEGRKMKCRCTCKLSSKKANSLSCRSMEEEDREKNFKYFWKVLKDWSGRKAYVSSLVERKKITKRRKESIVTNSIKRKTTYKYHLLKDEIRMNVCKKMFLHTLDLGERSVQTWLHELSHDNAGVEEDNFEDDLPLGLDYNGPDSTSSTSSKRKRPSEDGKSRSVEEFFQGLPKMESHYCRASSQKVYLEPGWDSKVALFREYKQKFCDENTTSASWSVFSRVMYKLNIDLYQPKKDQCETCIKHKLGTISEEQFKIHTNKKERSRAEKLKDKERATDSESLGVYTVDVQAVLMLPNIMSSSAYYKTKLKLHNYTIYNMKNADVTCFLWHEANGGLESDVFASILYKFLQKEINEKKLSEIIIWSDGCAYQNRCEKISNALLHISNVTQVKISHKYLEVGHTHMEVDSVHSKIEKKIRGKEFYIPFDYVKAIREARSKPSEFNVEILKYTDFLNFSNGYYSSIRPGLKKGDPVVTDVCAFSYLKGVRLQF